MEKRWARSRTRGSGARSNQLKASIGVGANGDQALLLAERVKLSSKERTS